MNMNDKQIDELINKALQEDMALPHGLSERLEERIDTLFLIDEKKKKRSLLRKRSLYWLSGAAAIALLCIGIFQYTGSLHQEHRLTDTYSDPKEAAIVAQKALQLMSVNLNKGINQMNDAQQEINKVNNILNKHLND